MKFKFLLFTLGVYSACALSSGDHSTSAPPVVKEGGAVSEVSAEDGFKLSDRAIQNLGISFETLEGKGAWKVPNSALVYIKHSVAVYRKWNGWITMVLVTPISKNQKFTLIKSVDLQEHDQIAIKGVAFLRMTDADLNSETVDSCAH